MSSSEDEQPTVSFVQLLIDQNDGNDIDEQQIRIFSVIRLGTPYWITAKIARGKNRLRRYGTTERFLDLAYIHIIFLLFWVGLIAVIVASFLIWTQHGQGKFTGLCITSIACTRPCVITTNPDIAGVGVRIATYLQAISHVILLGFSSKDLPSTRNTVAITSISLILCALVMTIRGSLSLHEAITTLRLLDITMGSAYFVEPWTNRSPELHLAHSFRFLGVIAMTYWVFLKGYCFGSRERCNVCLQQFRIPVGEPIIRGITLILYGGLLANWIYDELFRFGFTLIFGAFRALLSQEARRRWIDDTQQREEYWRWDFDKRNRWFWTWVDDDTVTSTVFKKESEATGHLGLLDRVFFALRIARCQRAMFSLIFVVIYIQRTETFIYDNLDVRAKEWGFGQVAAMILSGPSVLSLIRLIVGCTRDYDASREPLEVDESFLHARLDFYTLYFPSFTTYKPLAPRSPTDITEYSTDRVTYTEEQLVRQPQHRQRILKMLSSTTTSLQHNQHHHEGNL